MYIYLYMYIYKHCICIYTYIYVFIYMYVIKPPATSFSLTASSSCICWRAKHGSNAASSAVSRTMLVRANHFFLTACRRLACSSEVGSSLNTVYQSTRAKTESFNSSHEVCIYGDVINLNSVAVKRRRLWSSE